LREYKEIEPNDTAFEKKKRGKGDVGVTRYRKKEHDTPGRSVRPRFGRKKGVMGEGKIGGKRR